MNLPAQRIRNPNPRLAASAPLLPADRSGIAVLLLLGVLCVTLAISYALSRTSVTTASLSLHECGGPRARAVAETSVTTPMLNLRSNPNWMPARKTTYGALAVDQRYQVSLEISGNGNERSFDAAAQVYDPSNIAMDPNGGTRSTVAPSSTDRPVADQHLKIQLAKQTRNDLPIAAIAAFDSNTSLSKGPPVYIANGNKVRGDVRSKGPIQFQEGFELEGKARVMGDVTRNGTDAKRYITYRASWGSTYQAESLAQYGLSDGQGGLILQNLVLGPSSTNPMGVFCYTGDPLILGDDVRINGTLVVQGNLTIRGTDIHLAALRQAEVPSDPEAAQGPARGGDSSLGTLDALTSAASSLFLDAFSPVSENDLLENVTSQLSGGTVVKTSFPAIVVDGDIVIEAQADVVRVRGLILAGSSFLRDVRAHGVLHCRHNHSLDIDLILDPFNSADGPAVVVQGAIMASQVNLDHRSERPFALVFDPLVTNVRDAPGFFTWRVADWQAAN